MAQSKPPLKIFYGSQTGTATLFSNMLAKEAKDKAWESSVVDMEEYDPVGCDLCIEFSFNKHRRFQENLSKEKLVVFVTSCFGRGEPTDNARKMFNWLMVKKDLDVGKTGNFVTIP